jgi:DNA sulfur modification protein DndB
VSAAFEYAFPAIQGIQAGREYYTSMCPLRLIPKIFVFNEESMAPEVRAQRQLNKARLPEMTRYIIDNPNDYVFSSITASVDSAVSFEPLGQEPENRRIGVLRIPMTANFLINDGQHRRAAIEVALNERPELADETIAVVFFLDFGLERCQQMFADLNRHVVRPSKSLGVLYDHRDEMSLLVKNLIFRAGVFRDLIEMERSTLSLRSRKLFTLSAVYSANKALLAGEPCKNSDKMGQMAMEFWEEVSKHMPDWALVREGQLNASEIRQDKIHSHGIVLQALGKVGNGLFQAGGSWKRKLAKLRTMDWSRSNAKLWEGRAMIGGRISKASHNLTLTTNAIKIHLGIELSPEEHRVERAINLGERQK